MRVVVLGGGFGGVITVRLRKPRNRPVCTVPLVRTCDGAVAASAGRVGAVS
jgi:NADH dehydrogenase FAD-containing subunit